MMEVWFGLDEVLVVVLLLFQVLSTVNISVFLKALLMYLFKDVSRSYIPAKKSRPWELWFRLV